MSINIPAEHLPFVQTLVATGQYASETAVVGAALQMMSERNLRLEQFRAELIAADEEIDRGECETVHPHEIAGYMKSIFNEAMEEFEAERAKP